MAKNTIGETISREARMTVRQGAQAEPTRPQFVQIPAGHVFFDEESDYIVMHCVASGVPQPHIQWTFNDQPLHENTERVQIYENGTLVIHNPIEEDEGSYKCEAANYLGTISTVANYKINGKAVVASSCLISFSPFFRTFQKKTFGNFFCLFFLLCAWKLTKTQQTELKRRNPSEEVNVNNQDEVFQ